VPPKSAEAIESEFKLLPASVNLSQYNEDYLAKHKDCARRTLSALKIRKLLAPESAGKCEKDVVGILKLPKITLKEAKEGLELLISWKSSEVNTFRKGATVKWPEASVFDTFA
jgi:hypothetical protein